LELLLDSLFNGVAIGSVLLVAALGLAIVFGLMGVINLAHGELMMLGAYTTYVTQLIFKLPILKPFYNSYIIVSIFLAFIVSGVVGILLEKTIIRKLYGSPLETLLATWGVSLILQQFVRSVPLAYGTGLIISLIIGLFLPTTFPSKIKESINFKYFSHKVFFRISESNQHKRLPAKGFEGNQSQINRQAKATGCIELQNACDNKYLTPVISQLN